MIDETNREEVLEKLESIVWAYYIQLSSLDALLEVAENIDKIEITIEKNDEQENNLEKIEVPKIQIRKIKALERNNSKISSKSNIPKPVLPPVKDVQISDMVRKMLHLMVEHLLRISIKIEETKQKVLLRSLLIYSMSIWESFLRDYLRIVLSYNWEVLKNVKKDDGFKFSFGEIIERLDGCETVGDFRSELIEDYLFKLFYKSIDEISEELNRLHLIKLKEFEYWKKLREAYYKRNVVTHNNGIINKKYCRDIGLSDCKVGQEVEITPDYLRDISDVLGKFIEFVHTRICNKYKLDGYLKE